MTDKVQQESGCEVNCTTKSEDLEESAYEYANDANHYVEWSDGWETDNDFEYVNEAFKAGAEWQKQQMMKNTVLETKVMMDCDGDGIETPYEEWLTLENTEILSLPDNIGLKDGDKVKIIIVKED